MDTCEKYTYLQNIIKLIPLEIQQEQCSSSPSQPQNALSSSRYRTVFGSAVLCLQNVAEDDGGDVEASSLTAAKGQEEERPLQMRQQHRPIASAASSEDGLQMEVEAGEEGAEEGEEEEREEESRQMIGKDGD